MAYSENQRARRRAGAILASVLLGIAPSAALPAQPALLVPVYQATFPNGSLECCFVDRLHALEKGDSRVPDSDPSWSASKGTLKIGVKAPNPQPGTVSAGVFSTGLSFGIGTVFSVRATFQEPKGPEAAGKVWAAAAVAARTGGKDDLEAEKRLTVTFRRNGSIVKLNVQGINESLSGNDIPPTVYNRIFDPHSPEPFTIELLVDRKNGNGLATFKAGSFTLPIPFTMKVFQASSGPPITAVGAMIAISDAPGEPVSVLLRDFRISAPAPSP